MTACTISFGCAHLKTHTPTNDGGYIAHRCSFMYELVCVCVSVCVRACDTIRKVQNIRYFRHRVVYLLLLLLLYICVCAIGSLTHSLSPRYPFPIPLGRAAPSVRKFFCNRNDPPRGKHIHTHTGLCPGCEQK